MNEIIIEISESKDFFTNELLDKEDMVIVPLFPFSVRGEEVYNYVVTSKEKMGFLKTYKPTLEDVERLTVRNKKLLERLSVEYDNLSLTLKSNMRNINYYRQVDKSFIDQLMTKEEKDIFNGNLQYVSDLRVEMSEIKVFMNKLERSISNNYLERSLSIDVTRIHEELVEEEIAPISLSIRQGNMDK